MSRKVLADFAGFFKCFFVHMHEILHSASFTQPKRHHLFLSTWVPQDCQHIEWINGAPLFKESSKLLFYANDFWLRPAGVKGWGIVWKLKTKRYKGNSLLSNYCFKKCVNAVSANNHETSIVCDLTYCHVRKLYSLYSEIALISAEASL